MKNVTQSRSVPAMRSRVNNWPTGEPSTLRTPTKCAPSSGACGSTWRRMSATRVLPALEDEIAYRLRQHEHEHHGQDERKHAAKDEHTLPTVRGDQPRRGQTT